MRTSVLLILALGSAPVVAGPRHVTYRPGDADPARDPHFFAYSPEVVFDASRGTIRLAKSVLVADETGATDYTQTLTLTDRVWAKKTFDLAAAEAESAQLLFFGTAAEVTVNGERLAKPERLPSTGWFHVAVSPRLLKAGANEVILKGPGQVLIEPAGKPGRSGRSIDGGQTWSAADAGGKGHATGEYVVRLRLGRFARTGWAESAVVDLWTAADGIGRPGKLTGIKALDVGKQPEGTTLRPLVRLGPTPTPGHRWTAWAALDRDYTPSADAAGFRWAQLRFELATTRPLAGPELGKFQLDFDVTPEPERGRNGAARPGRADDRPRRPAGLGPVRLPGTVGPAGGPAGAAQARRGDRRRARPRWSSSISCGYWVRNQWHTAWGSNPAAWMPPWDALIILESKDQPDCLTMCTHYAAVFTQCCLALGWNARHCILDHHCIGRGVRQPVPQVGDDGRRQLHASGPTCGLHFERGGVPLSALRTAPGRMRSGKTADLPSTSRPPAPVREADRRCAGPAPAGKKHAPAAGHIPAGRPAEYPVCQTRELPPLRLPAAQQLPGVAAAGRAVPGLVGVLLRRLLLGRRLAGPAADSPEYSRHLSPDRPQDIDWSLNWCGPTCRTGTAGELRVQLETQTPNLPGWRCGTGRRRPGSRRRPDSRGGCSRGRTYSRCGR